MVKSIIFSWGSISFMPEEREIRELINKLAVDYHRFEAADALISQGSRAVEPLLAALKLDNWKIRGNAAWTLGKIGDRRAVTPLIDALGDEVPEVRASAGQAILSIGKPAIEPLSESIRSARVRNRKLASGLLSALMG